jgi:hypothetical protein
VGSTSSDTAVVHVYDANATARSIRVRRTAPPGFERENLHRGDRMGARRAELAALTLHGEEPQVRVLAGHR